MDTLAKPNTLPELTPATIKKKLRRPADIPKVLPMMSKILNVFLNKDPSKKDRFLRSYSSTHSSGLFWLHKIIMLNISPMMNTPKNPSATNIYE